MTLIELQADLDVIERALHSASTVAAGMDQIEAARALRDKPAWSGFRTLVEQAKEAHERVMQRLRPGPGDEPCIPPDALARP